MQEVEGREGQQVELMVNAMNEGGATRGLVFSVSGAAVDEKRLAPRALTVLHRLVVVEQAAFTKRGDVFVVELPSLEFPAKVDVGAVRYQRQHEANEASSLLFKVSLDLQKAGSGQLVFTAVCGESTVGPVVAKAPVAIVARRVRS